MVIFNFKQISSHLKHAKLLKIKPHNIHMIFRCKLGKKNQIHPQIRHPIQPQNIPKTSTCFSSANLIKKPNSSPNPSPNSTPEHSQNIHMLFKCKLDKKTKFIPCTATCYSNSSLCVE